MNMRLLSARCLLLWCYYILVRITATLHVILVLLQGSSRLGEQTMLW
jgi:hypothetical protein